MQTTTITKPAVEIDRVSKLYASANGQLSWALQDVSLTVDPAEFVCVIGPSGCGKTTLLNLIAGFTAPTRGEVKFNGQRVSGSSPDRGVVFQEYALFPWLTAKENVEFGLKIQATPTADRKQLVREFLHLAGLSDAADRYPHELSGGMRQRVAVVRALVNRPQILLMDEPFAAVDAMTRLVLQEELLRLWEQVKFGIFFITHNIEEAIFLAQQIVVMSSYPGQIKAIIPVQLPYPRDRSSTSFSQVYAAVSNAFHSKTS